GVSLGTAWVKNRGASNDHAGAGRDDATDVTDIDSAVDFDGCGVAHAVEKSPDVPDFGLAAGNEGLSPEPGVNRHHEHVVDIRRDGLQKNNRCRWVDDDASFDPEILDGVHGAMEVRKYLDVNRHHRRAGFRKRFNVPIRVCNHGVNIGGHLGEAVGGG